MTVMVQASTRLCQDLAGILAKRIKGESRDCRIRVRKPLTEVRKTLSSMGWRKLDNQVVAIEGTDWPLELKKVGDKVQIRVMGAVLAEPSELEVAKKLTIPGVTRRRPRDIVTEVEFRVPHEVIKDFSAQVRKLGFVLTDAVPGARSYEGKKLGTLEAKKEADYWSVFYTPPVQNTK